MKKWLIVLMCLIVITGTCVFLFATCLEAANEEKDLAKAEALWEKAEKLYPNRYITAKTGNNCKKAMKKYKKIAKKYQGTEWGAKAQLRLGDCYRSFGDYYMRYPSGLDRDLAAVNYERAMQVYEKVIQNYPKSKYAELASYKMMIASGAATRYAYTILHRDFGWLPNRIAVLPANEHSSSDISLADSMVTRFLDRGSNVIERVQLKKILDEHKLSLSGILEAETRQLIGKILNINAIVICSNKYNNNINIRMIDLQTGVVILSVDANNPHGWGANIIAGHIILSIDRALGDRAEFVLENYAGMIGIDGKLSDKYFVIKDVVPGMPAEKVGLQKGDKIFEVDGQPCSGLTEFGFTLKVRGKPGTKVKLKVLRKNKKLEFEIERKEWEIFE